MLLPAVVLVEDLLLGATAVLLAAPLAVLGVECLAALLPQRRSAIAESDERPAVAVLVPAHNEELALAETLRSIQPQLRDGDRLIVIADNCTDATAAVARSLGAGVIERQDANKRGKGFAMDFGLSHVAQDPPPVVIFTDADCLLAPRAIDELARQVKVTGRPAQALYLMDPPPGGSLRDAVSACAFLLKNQVRPAGLARLGLHCPLFGTGMAFPYPVLRQVPLADGNIVEDLQLGLNLIRAGAAPAFCPTARVTGRLPVENAAAMTQRRRWEHGHVRTIFTQVPRMLAEALRRRNVIALATAMDLCVPPLSLLAFGVMLGLIVLGGTAALGAWTAPFVLLASVVGITLVTLLGVYLKFGRTMLRPGALLGIPSYVLWKAPMYVAMLVRPQRQWVQTPRTGAAPSMSSAATANASVDPLEAIGVTAGRSD
ncbi:MAG TPA: glycosyltransferase [Tepidisphaeraceae bacterium]|jgi:cellulose synthase/poly-beta-1,6-N-acetylglucosamine synthase-like glycosyltransferase